jgi:guanosine-3',5'-bis(diphosphate) 3'-pyrophosphohydrolase
MLGAADAARIQDACAFAARRHQGQLRRDGRTPYVSHLCRVALTVAVNFGCRDACAIATAMLHDIIEDTSTDYEDVESRFGKDVAVCVAALTENKSLPEVRREKDYDARLAAAPWQARLVKLADVFDNLCDIESYPPDRRESKRRDAVERAKRAIALAMPDAAREPVATAIGAVLTLLEAQPRTKQGGSRRHAARKRK